ncbi:MAG: hypothetical protein ACJAW8_002529 [Oleispira sp.]|jgi:hypothetical protein
MGFEQIQGRLENNYRSDALLSYYIEADKIV